MKFSSVIEDKKAFDDLYVEFYFWSVILINPLPFLDAASSVNRFLPSEYLTMKILPDSVYFVGASGRNEGYFMEIRLSETDIFSQYKMDGISSQNNVIVMTIDAITFKQILTAEEEKARLKLTKKGEIPTLSASFKPSGIHRDVPVKIIKSDDLQYYSTPAVNGPLLEMILKPVKAFKDIFDTWHEMKIDDFEITLRSQGIVTLKASCEGCKYEMDVGDLPITRYVHGDEDRSFHLKVDLFYRFLNALPNDARQFNINISDRDQIILSLKHSTVEYILYMTAIRQENV